MKKERLFTIIIVPRDSRRMRQFRVSPRILYLFASVALAFVVVGLFATFRYFTAISRLDGYERTVETLGKLREENVRFRAETEGLTEKLAYMETMTRTISHLAGIDMGNPVSTSGGMGGIGGRALQGLGLNGPERLPDLRRRMKELESSLVRMKNETLERSLFLSSIPSEWPVRGYISSWFGGRPDPFSGAPDFHAGLDIAAPSGARVVAAADGTVLFAGAQSGYGYTVILWHRYGITSRYAHLSAIEARTGQSLKKGDSVGYVGSTGRSTGPHLHYEVHLNGKPVNPILFLNRGNPS
ncbi:MAG: M23 family metallopeptidase [Acidobacteria bacterium]|nr:M23 family metallopeptidase [Acidobacteriota bacterium]